MFAAGQLVLRSTLPHVVKAPGAFNSECDELDEWLEDSLETECFNGGMKCFSKIAMSTKLQKNEIIQ
jgi:hypothetical protein